MECPQYLYSIRSRLYQHPTDTHRHRFRAYTHLPISHIPLSHRVIALLCNFILDIYADSFGFVSEIGSKTRQLRRSSTTRCLCIIMYITESLREWLAQK